MINGSTASKTNTTHPAKKIQPKRSPTIKPIQKIKTASAINIAKKQESIPYKQITPLSFQNNEFYQTPEYVINNYPAEISTSKKTKKSNVRIITQRSPRKGMLSPQQDTIHPFVFDPPLIEGIILDRPHPFVMNVEINGEEHRCHSPATGKIGQIIFDRIPCLLSKSTSSDRKTPFTVEAISLDPIDVKKKTWVGINQTRVNRYIEFFIKQNVFNDILFQKTNDADNHNHNHNYNHNNNDDDGDDTAGINNNDKAITSFRREVKLDSSRIDFCLNNTFLEVKTPIQYLQAIIPDHIKQYPPKKHPKRRVSKKITEDHDKDDDDNGKTTDLDKINKELTTTNRMMRHLQTLTRNTIENGSKHPAKVFLAFLYNNPGFQLPDTFKDSAKYFSRTEYFKLCQNLGIDTYQVNFQISPHNVKLSKFFKVDVNKL